MRYALYAVMQRSREQPAAHSQPRGCSCRRTAHAGQALAGAATAASCCCIPSLIARKAVPGLRSSSSSSRRGASAAVRRGGPRICSVRRAAWRAMARPRRARRAVSSWTWRPASRSGRARKQRACSLAQLVDAVALMLCRRLRRTDGAGDWGDRPAGQRGCPGHDGRDGAQNSQQQHLCRLARVPWCCARRCTVHGVLGDHAPAVWHARRPQVVYTTACAAPSPSGDGSFVPLTVNYAERFSAAGRTA